MIYQAIVKVLREYNNPNAMRYCNDNIFDLVILYEGGHTIDQLVDICLNHK